MKIARFINLEILMIFSQWSEMVAVTTLAICPGQCQAPKLQGKPKATMLHLRWGKWPLLSYVQCLNDIQPFKTKYFLHKWKDDNRKNVSQTFMLNG